MTGRALLRFIDLLRQRLAGLIEISAIVVLDLDDRRSLIRVGRYLLYTLNPLKTLLQWVGDILLDDGR